MSWLPTLHKSDARLVSLANYFRSFLLPLPPARIFSSARDQPILKFSSSHAVQLLARPSFRPPKYIYYQSDNILNSLNLIFHLSNAPRDVFTWMSDVNIRAKMSLGAKDFCDDHIVDTQKRLIKRLKLVWYNRTCSDSDLLSYQGIFVNSSSRFYFIRIFIFHLTSALFDYTSSYNFSQCLWFKFICDALIPSSRST